MSTYEDLISDELSSITVKSRRNLLKKFKSFDEVSAKCFYNDILKGVKHFISLDEFHHLKHLSWLLNEINKYKNEENLKNYVENAKIQIKNFNPIILACKSKAINTLRHILENKNKILYNLSCKINNKEISPNDEDEFHHNAFYYAMRSNMTEVLRILINQWPNNYFDKNTKLDEILTKNYKELKLRNVFLTKEMEVYVQKEIFNIRFFHSNSKDRSTGSSMDLTQKRVELVIENIEFIKSAYWDSDPDEKFILVGEFIAKNIHVLKSVLKFTYDKLPWEEVEFYLGIYIESCKKNFETNLVYNTVLRKNRLLKYLEKFSTVLQSEMKNIAKDDTKKKLDREKIVENIIKNHSIFQDLYSDYEIVRDFCSLDIIKDYTSLAISSDASTEEGKLIIIRALQVTGEHIKNTLVTPKLSNTSAHVLLYSLPLKSRDIITKLRDCLSHDDYLRVRSEIEKQSSIFFKDIQGDLSMMNNMATEVLSKIIIEQLKIVLLKLKQCKYWREVKGILKTYSFSFESIVAEIKKLKPDAFIKSDIESLQELLLNLFELMGERTEFENHLFQEINGMIKSEKDISMDENGDILLIIQKIYTMSYFSQEVDVDEEFNFDLESFKFIFQKTDTSISPLLDFTYEAARLLLESIISRADPNNTELRIIISKIIHLIAFQMGKVKRITEFADIICTEKSKNKRSKEVKFKEILTSKISLLKKFLTEYNIIDNLLLPNLSFFENNRKLQVVIEMLVLDILALLTNECTYNDFFLDNDYVLQTGRNLRNNLAHINSIINNFSYMVPLQLLLNAQALVAENFANKYKILGQVEKCNPQKLKNTHKKNLSIIRNQKALFVALSEGNMRKIEESVREGADIFGKDLKSTSCLHFSSKAPNTETIKYTFEQGLDINSKDFNGQTVLHFAVKFNRLKTVEYLLMKGVSVNSSNSRGLTPLNIAAENNNLEVVKCLLKRKASTSKNVFHLPPLHHAIFKGNIEVAKVLLENETNVDKIKAHEGLTALHTAAKKGEPYLVKLLIQKQAKIDSKDDFENTPLHFAADTSSLQVVKDLISESADVNARNIQGNTPLFNAALNGNEVIVKFLLLHGADVRARDGYFCVPLHYASVNGHLGISELFLNEDSTLANAKNCAGQTPLHYAAGHGRAELVKLLLKFNAITDSADNDNATALHISSYYGYPNIVHSLVESGANTEIEGTTKDSTPLHLASKQGHFHIVEFLISNGADIHFRASCGMTSLEIAALGRYTNIVKLLLAKGAKFPEIYMSTQLNLTIFNAVREMLLDESIEKTSFITENLGQLLYLAATFGGESILKFCLKKGCNVNIRNESGLTALHFAAFNNHPHIVTFLLENGADINIKDVYGETALCLAAKGNSKEVICILIEKQAENMPSLVSEISRSLYLAVVSGHGSVVNVLFQKGRFDVTSLQQSYDFLHKASEFGHRKVVGILLDKGFETDFLWNDRTPLHYAVFHNHCEVARLLISKGASVNIQDGDGKTVLHSIVEAGRADLLHIALNDGADVSIKDKKNRSVIEIAVSSNQLENVKILLQKANINVNSKDNKGYSLLHICAETGLLDMTKYLTLKGSDMRAKDMNGSKPVHIATQMGHTDIVEFYLNKNISANDLGQQNFTPLHFAVLGGKPNVCEYLIDRGANINAFAENGISPVHLAAANDNEEILRILLHNGAYYNTSFTSKIAQLSSTECHSVSNILETIEKLFIGVKNNDPLEVETLLKEANQNKKFSIVNAKCMRNDTSPLLNASSEGYEEIVDILLKFQANPNICDKHKLTSLHFAAQFSHLNIVKALLKKGAIYNPLCFKGKTPLEYATNQVVINLLRFADKVFTKSMDKNNSVLKILKNSKNEEFSKLMQRAKDRKGNTLVATAILNGLPKTEQLKELFQDDLVYQWKEVTDSSEALNKFKTVLERRNEIFGEESPATLDIQEQIARCLLNIQKYDEALYLLHEIYRKRKTIFSECHKETLTVKCLIAIIRHRQGKTSEAFELFEKNFKHKNFLGLNHDVIFVSEIEMSEILAEKGCFVEALNMINDVYDKSNKENGSFHKITLDAQYNKARVLKIQGNLLEAKEIYKKIESIKINMFPPSHTEVLKVQTAIANLLFELRKFDESLEKFKEIQKILKFNYPSNHFLVLSNKSDIARIFLVQGMTIKALKIFLAVESKTAKFGADHPLVKANKADIESVVFRLRLRNSEWLLEKIRNELKLVETENRLKNLEADVNTQDEEGRTALHIAVDDGERERVDTLLEKGADVFMVTKEGKTALHIAVARGYDDMVERIFNHAETQNQLSAKNLINAKDGNLLTALHLVSNVKTAKWLLKHGAIYNAKNSFDQTPLDLARNTEILGVLMTIDYLFNAVRNGIHSVINELDGLDHEEALAAANARNCQDHCLLQVSIVNQQKDLAREIGNWLIKENLQVK